MTILAFTGASIIRSLGWNEIAEFFKRDICKSRSGLAESLLNFGC
jgi:hypothetical protein